MEETYVETNLRSEAFYYIESIFLQRNVMEKAAWEDVASRGSTTSFPLPFAASGKKLKPSLVHKVTLIGLCSSIHGRYPDYVKETLLPSTPSPKLLN